MSRIPESLFNNLPENNDLCFVCYEDNEVKKICRTCRIGAHYKCLNDFLCNYKNCPQCRKSLNHLTGLMKPQSKEPTRPHDNFSHSHAISERVLAYQERARDLRIRMLQGQYNGFRARPSDL